MPTALLREVIASERVLGRPVMAVFGDRRADDPPVLVAASGHIKQEAGWAPQ